MRRKDLKKALAAAWAAPEPAGKRAFLRAMPPAPVSHMRFLLGQAGYISPVTWAASFAVLLLALTAGRFLPADAVWVTSALTPFAALAAVAEGARSALYGMEELELSSRFGLKSLALARMGLVGLVHLGMLAVLAPLGPAGLLRTGAYLLTPYLLTDLLGLAAVRRIRGREALYVCAGAAVLVAGLALGLARGVDAYGPGAFRWWLPALAAVLALTAREYHTTIRKTEELSWN